MEGNTFNETRKTSVRIVREGTQRREEYETVAAGWVAHLETLKGRFVLLPAEKLYADLSEASDDAKLSELQTESQTMQSDYILHESNLASSYEKLGNETIDGRQTVKYRVTALSSNVAIPASERVVWVDEDLGMPVKTEFIQRGGTRWSRVLVQLTDIRTEVDLTQFDIPGDYRKVKASQIFDLIARRAATTRVEKPQ